MASRLSPLGGRANLPAGPLGGFTYATAAPRAAAAAANPAIFTVPPGVLTDGPNVIAASTHVGLRSTPDIGFDLQLIGLVVP